MVIIGDLAYNMIDTKKTVGLVEIICKSEQLRTIESDFDIRLHRKNRFVYESSKHGLAYRAIIADKCPGLIAILSRYKEEDSYYFADEEVSYVIYKELSLYRNTRVTSWFRYFSNFRWLKDNYIINLNFDRQKKLDTLSHRQRQWISSLDEVDVRGYQYKLFNANLFTIQELISCINPESDYEFLVNFKYDNEILYEEFDKLTYEEKLQFVVDKFWMDVFTEVIIPIEFVDKKRDDMSRFLQYSLKKITMFNYCKNNMASFHSFIDTNYDDIEYEFLQNTTAYHNLKDLARQKKYISNEVQK